MIIKHLRNLFLKNHFVLPVSILVLINAFLARNWISAGLPKGHDAMAALPVYYPLQQALFSNSTLLVWDSYWYFGHPSVWRLSQFLGLFITSDAALKFFFAATFMFAGVSAYFFVYELTKNAYASFFAAIFYTYLPYSLLSAIFEGHITLSLLYTLTPLVFLLMEKHSKSLSVKSTIFAGVMLAAFLLSAPQAFPLMSPFIIAYGLFKISKLPSKRNFPEFIKRTLVIFAPWLIGLLLSAYWWLPMLLNRNLFEQTQYSLQSTIQYTRPLIELITFRPPSDCSPATGFGVSPWPVSIMQLSIPVIALAALLFFYKNRYVLFFSITSLIAFILAMGVKSPIPLFSYAFEYIPFFNGVRTPGRFLFFAALAFSVLAGFTIIALQSRLKKKHKILPFLLVVGLSVLVIGNVYGETQQAFQTFELTPSQNAAMSWLSTQPDGRLLSLPWQTWVYSPETRNIVFPWNYIQLTDKETVSGGAPSLELVNTADLLDILRSQVYNQNVASTQLLDIMGVRYVVLDKNYPNYFSNVQYDAAYAELNSSSSFKQAWSGDNVTIFENLNAFPRVFVMTKTNTSIGLFDNTSTPWKWAQGTKYPAQLVWDPSTTQNGNVSLQSTYQFTNSGRDWLNIGTDVSNINFTGYDALSFSYYLTVPQSDVRFGVSLFENDGSQYTAPIQIDTTPGWHTATVSFATLQMTKDNTNQQLDLDQIKTLWIGVTETANYAPNKLFNIYFSNMQLVKYQYIFNQTIFQQIHPGKYQVNLNLQQDAYVVLAESYSPQWIATDQQTGKTTTSQPLFIALNGFQNQKGEHQIILEYTQSTPEIIGEAASITTLAACVGALILIPLRKRIHIKKETNRQNNQH